MLAKLSSALRTTLPTAAVLLGSVMAAQTAAPQEAMPGMPPTGIALEARERIITIHKPDWPFGSTPLQVTLFTPPGHGPFPLIVINHGKPPGKPADMPRARFPSQSAEFLRRGYMVALPMREGFGKSGGWYYGGSCDIGRNGIVQAEDINATIGQLRQLPEVSKEHILVIGQSHGGLATLALGMHQPPGVRGLVNFAGGLKIEQCVDWAEQLEQAFALYARKGRENLTKHNPAAIQPHGLLPTLWFYGTNDSHWSPTLIERLEQSYREAGGLVRRIDVGPFGQDAHLLFGHAQGNALWLPELGRFVQSLGMPWPEALTAVIMPPSLPIRMDQNPDPALSTKPSNAGQHLPPLRPHKPSGAR